MAEKKLTIEERRAINRKEYEKYMNEKVTVNIPLGAEQPGTTTTASCDGTVYEIELGKDVKIPRKVAEVIKRSINGNIKVQEKIAKTAGKAAQIGEY